MLKNSLKIFFIFIILTACTKQLLIKNYKQPESSIQMFGKVPERSFYYPVTLPDSLELKWEENTKGSYAKNSVLFENNYLFITDLAGNIFCFLADTGKTVGADKLGGEIPVAPVLNGGWIYYINTLNDEDYSLFIRYDIRSGKRMNDVKMPGRVSAELIKFDDGIFVINENGLAIFYNDYLETVWENNLKKKIITSPAANSRNIFLADLDGNIISLNKSDGEIVFQKKLSRGFESIISLKNDFGFVGDINGDLIAFNLKNGNEVWRSKTFAKIKTAPVMNEKLIYISNLAGSIYCFDINTGKKIWKYNSEGIFNTTPALFKNVLLQPDLNEKLLFINPLTGNLNNEWEFEDRLKLSPVYYREMLYIGKDRGEILAYKLVRENR